MPILQFFPTHFTYILPPLTSDPELLLQSGTE